MKNNSLNTSTNIFFSNVEPRFNSFRKKIIKLSKQNQIEFDEDVFMDTIIRCSETFNIIDASNDDIDTYFWVAYKQNCFSKFNRDKFKDTVDLDDYKSDLIDEDYNADIDTIVDLIKSEVKNEFGDYIYDAWYLHTCEGYSYTELIKNGYEGLNLHNEVRQIKRHILNKYVKNNKKFKNLLQENGLL